MVRPDRDAFVQLAQSAGRGRAVPLVREVLADLDTPLAIFLKVDDGATAFLFWVRSQLKPLLVSRGMRPRAADVIAKAGPVMGVAATTALTFGLGLDTARTSLRDGLRAKLRK